MLEPKKVVFVLCLLCGAQTPAHARDTRGELLYSTHCNACHSTKIYWRAQKLATDWNSLLAQVELWQDSIGLNWSEEEITDVAHYLNALHYGFPVTAEIGLSQGKIPDRALRKD